MDITKIDKNFLATAVTEINGKFFNLPCMPFSIYGGWYDNEHGFIKVPLDVAKSASETVLWGSRCTAGIRVLFSTDSSRIKLYTQLFQKCIMNHMPLTGSASFTLCEVENGKEIFIGNFIPSFNGEESSFVAQLDLKGEKMRNYILYFPLYSGVLQLALEFDKNASVREYKKYEDVKPILYYGSSITQGGCASRANNCYQAFVSEWLNRDFLLLGYSGGAKAEQAICEYLSQIDCSVFVCDYDYNASSVEYLNDTHIELYKAFRSNYKNRKTPIIFMTKPDGYRNLEGTVRARIIHKTYEYAKNMGDDNVYFLDGRTIYPKSIREHCAVDGCHPTDLGFFYIAKKVFEKIKGIGK